MIVTMVFIGIVGVSVPRWFVLVFVNVRPIRGSIMIMPVVTVIVDMGMCVLRCFVFMLVRMAFGNVEPNPSGHQSPRQNKGDCYGIAQQGNGDDGANEGGGGKIRPRPGRAKFPQGNHKQRKADPISQKADNGGH